MRAALLFVATAVGVLLSASLAAVLIGVIYRLATSPLPPRFDIGDALAGLVYLAAFLPNVLVCIAALSMGAPIVVGAEIGVGSDRVGPLLEYSLASWGNGSAPPIAYLLLLIPLASFLAAGFATRAMPRDRIRSPIPAVLGAVITAGVMGLLCLVADARLGAGLVGGNGVAQVAPEASSVVLLTLGWALAAGLAGWALHDQVEGRPNIAAYRKSPRFMAFNERGIFRHYPELDAAADS